MKLDFNSEKYFFKNNMENNIVRIQFRIFPNHEFEQYILMTM